MAPVFQWDFHMELKVTEKSRFLSLHALVGPRISAESLSRTSKQVLGFEENNLRTIHGDTTPYQAQEMRTAQGRAPEK